MKLGTRLVSVLSSAALVAALAAGCSAGETAPSAAPLPKLDYIPQDIVLETAGIAGSTPLAKVDGVDVTAEQLLYWVGYTADNFAQTMGQYTGGVIDWSMDMGDGTTMKDYILDNALQTAKLYQVVENKAKELGYTISAEDLAAYESDLAAMKSSLAAQVGSEDQDTVYVQWLATVGLTDAAFAKVNQTSYLYKAIRDGMYGAQGKEAPTEEALAAWGEESGILRAKHILIKSTAAQDATDQEKTDAMAAALEKADAIRAELKAAGDTQEKFDELMSANSEDVNPYTGEQNCPPEGYTFGPGEMVPSFEAGTKALAMGAVSEPVASDYGYHIILRLDVKEAYADAKTDALMDEWMETALVETTEAYDTLDVEAYYTKLGELRTAIQEKMFPQPEATPAPSGTPEASPAPQATPAPTETPAA